MPLVPAKCPQCGGNIEVDNTRDAGICKYCGTPFITEKAIQNYNIQNVQNLHADVVNVNDDTSIDNRVRAGETFMKLGDYSSAHKVFAELSEKCPYDYRSWWGLFLANSNNLTSAPSDSYYAQVLIDFLHSAYKVANKEEKSYIDKKLKPYRENIISKTIVKLNNSIDNSKNEISNILNKIPPIESKINDLENNTSDFDIIEKQVNDNITLIKIKIAKNENHSNSIGIIMEIILIAICICYVALNGFSIVNILIGLAIFFTFAFAIARISNSIETSLYNSKEKRLDELRKKLYNEQVKLTNEKVNEEIRKRDVEIEKRKYHSEINSLRKEIDNIKSQIEKYEKTIKLLSEI